MCVMLYWMSVIVISNALYERMFSLQGTKLRIGTFLMYYFGSILIELFGKRQT